MRLRTVVLAGAAVLAAAATGALTPPSASAATAGCSVSYRVTGSWQGGFQGDIGITNLGDPVPAWSLGFAFPAATQKVTQAWGGTATQSGAQVTITNAAWNGALGTNATTSVGFIGSWSGSNPAPTAFTREPGGSARP